jgi:hypothetical protein
MAADKWLRAEWISESTDKEYVKGQSNFIIFFILVVG